MLMTGWRERQVQIEKLEFGVFKSVTFFKFIYCAENKLERETKIPNLL